MPMSAIPGPPEEDEEQATGCPLWMVTYGDSITLLLTFFVLLLTFSTPNEEDYQRFARGLLKGSRTLGLGEGEPGQNSFVQEEQRLAASRLSAEGAEKPPMHDESPLSDLTHYHEDLDVSSLRDLQGAHIIRIPLVELFGTGSALIPEGEAVLDEVVKMTKARSYSIVVRTRALTGASPEEKAADSIALSLKLVSYIRSRAASTSQDVGVSNDECELSSPPLREGQCEIIMLEV